MKWEKFFFYLNRVNAVLLFTALCLFAVASLGAWWPFYGDVIYDPDNYGEPGLDHEPDIEGEKITIADGTVVKYIAQGAGEFDIDVEARNISLTHMSTGKSRLVLPQGSDQIVLRFEQVGRGGEGSEPSSAYIALVGTEKDYADGTLDLIIGRMTDLEQQTASSRISFVDSPRMIDDKTMSLIVWPAPDRAEFWLFDLSTMTRTLSRKVEVPLPREA